LCQVESNRFEAFLCPYYAQQKNCEQFGCTENHTIPHDSPYTSSLFILFLFNSFRSFNFSEQKHIEVNRRITYRKGRCPKEEIGKNLFSGVLCFENFGWRVVASKGSVYTHPKITFSITEIAYLLKFRKD